MGARLRLIELTAALSLATDVSVGVAGDGEISVHRGALVRLDDCRIVARHSDRENQGFTYADQGER